MNIRKSFLIFASILVFAGAAFGQGSWLDQATLENWNGGKRSVPPAPKYSAEELGRCGHTIRPASLTADRVLSNVGWKLVGPAEVWGTTSLVQVTREFDGQCRPLGYQYFVFVENKIAGTLSPKLMDARTDGALFQVELFNQGELRASYSRYKDSDPMCCASKVDAVFFSINESEDGSVLVPHDKMTLSGGDSSEGASGPSLANTKWKWTRFQSPVEDANVSEPENYTLEFGEDGKLLVQADCNRGSGSYQLEGSSLTIPPFALTRMACPGESQDGMFVKNLQWVRIVKIDGAKMYLDLFADGGTMEFEKVN